MLRGGAEKVVEAGACLAGGHSVEDPEPKYGLAVTGVVHPDRVLANGGARPGDAIVLTKPSATASSSTPTRPEVPLRGSGARSPAGDGRPEHGGVRGGLKYEVHGCPTSPGRDGGRGVGMAVGSGGLIERSFKALPLYPGGGRFTPRA